jgi:NADPH2:quinone reductase
MRAITVSKYGDSPVVTELPTPSPGSGQVLIKIQAAGMNPTDRSIANGDWQARMPGTFPLILSTDLAGVVETIGEGTTKFMRGDEVFGLLMLPPLGSVGTYAEYVAVTENAPLARLPKSIDAVVAAALPMAGATALDLAESLEPLSGKTVLIVGAGGGVGSFVTQFVAKAGAHIIVDVHSSADNRMRSYGAAETVDHSVVSVPDTVRMAHPDGIDVLIDVASDANEFAALASLVRSGGTAVTTKSVADSKALATLGVTGVNFRASISTQLLERLVHAVVTGDIVSPPITRITLDEVPRVLSEARTGKTDGKTVITL